MSKVSAGFLDIGESRLEYRYIDKGNDDSPTLVFLHEGLGSVATWKTFPDEVAEATGLNAFIFSRESYGKSSPLPLPRTVDYLEYEALEVLPGVLAAADIPRPLLIGHSDGASIALVYAGAGKRPRPVALVLMAAHVFNETLSTEGIERARQAYTQGDLRQRLGAYHADVDNAFWRWNDIWLDADFRHWNIEGYLAGIDVPLMHIQGSDDEYGTVAQPQAIKAGSSGTVELVMLDACAHSPFRDQGAATLAHITDFIRQLSLQQTVTTT